MPESATHVSLVQTIVRFVEREFGGLANVAIREDAMSPCRGEKPPKIEGHVPDVFVTDVPTTTTLIGEAKTRQDLESDRTRKQISAFLKYLSKTPQGIFVLCVPMVSAATARRLVSELNRPFKCTLTQTVILEWPNSSEH